MSDESPSREEILKTEPLRRLVTVSKEDFDALEGYLARVQEEADTLKRRQIERLKLYRDIVSSLQVDIEKVTGRAQALYQELNDALEVVEK